MKRLMVIWRGAESPVQLAWLETFIRERVAELKTSTFKFILIKGDEMMQEMANTTMSIEKTREVMESYWSSGHADTSMMADDVVFRIMADGQEARTPEGVQGLLHYFYKVAFEADATPANLIISHGRAVWEGVFHGRHTGEFAGIPATGKEVRVPLCVVYDLVNDQIIEARVYFEIPALLKQLGL
jgi:steroid delta-isomerase-like uncharacterized protein